MATKELQKTRLPRGGLGYEALTMAVGIMVERIQSLPKEDRDDLYELMKEIPKAETPDDVNSIAVSMREILDQSPIRLRALDQTTPFRPGSGLQKWIEFVSGRIRELRTKAGLTQVRLAAKAGLPQSHISRLENAEHSPSRLTLEKIARALGMPVSAFDPSA